MCACASFWQFQNGLRLGLLPTARGQHLCLQSRLRGCRVPVMRRRYSETFRIHMQLISEGPVKPATNLLLPLLRRRRRLRLRLRTAFAAAATTPTTIVISAAIVANESCEGGNDSYCRLYKRLCIGQYLEYCYYHHHHRSPISTHYRHRPHYLPSDCSLQQQQQQQCRWPSLLL